MTGGWSGKRVENSGRNAKIHGHIPGFPPGSRFKDRFECSLSGVHAPLRAGIHGNVENGAYSVVLSFGYEDDEDHGDWFEYTGEGGRDTKGDQMDQMMGKIKWEGRQNADQEWVRGNKALKVSAVTKKPVRVIRGSNRKKGASSQYAPSDGYRYDGLYVVEDAWRAIGKTGFKTCRFLFRRLPHQVELPGGAAQRVKSQIGKPNNDRSVIYIDVDQPTIKSQDNVEVNEMKTSVHSAERSLEKQEPHSISISVHHQDGNKLPLERSSISSLSGPLYQRASIHAGTKVVRPEGVHPLRMLPVGNFGPRYLPLKNRNHDDLHRRTTATAKMEKKVPVASGPIDSSTLFAETKKMYAGLKFNKVKKGD